MINEKNDIPSGDNGGNRGAVGNGNRSKERIELCGFSILVKRTKSRPLGTKRLPGSYSLTIKIMVEIVRGQCTVGRKIKKSAHSIHRHKPLS